MSATVKAAAAKELSAMGALIAIRDSVADLKGMSDADEMYELASEVFENAREAREDAAAALALRRVK